MWRSLERTAWEAATESANRRRETCLVKFLRDAAARWSWTEDRSSPVSTDTLASPAVVRDSGATRHRKRSYPGKIGRSETADPQPALLIAPHHGQCFPAEASARRAPTSSPAVFDARPEAPLGDSSPSLSAFGLGKRHHPPECYSLRHSCLRYCQNTTPISTGPASGDASTREPRKRVLSSEEFSVTSHDKGQRRASELVTTNRCFWQRFCFAELHVPGGGAAFPQKSSST